MKRRYIWLVRQTIRTLRHKRLRHRPWWRKLTLPLTDRHLWKPCRDSVAVGLSIGMFFAVMPMPGQAVVSAVLAMKLRGNVPFAVGACFLSNPFTMVPIWTAQVWIGSLVQSHLPVPMPAVFSRMETALPGLGTVNAGSFIVGSVVSGCLLALGSFLVIHCLARILPHHLPVTRNARAPLRTSGERP